MLITQDELTRYMVDLEAERIASGRRKQYEQAILAKLEAGCPIESGPLHAIRQSKLDPPSFSMDLVMDALGTARTLAALRKSKLAPTVTVSLKVVEAE